MTNSLSPSLGLELKVWPRIKLQLSSTSLRLKKKNPKQPQKPLVCFVSVLSWGKGGGVRPSQAAATRHRAAPPYNVGLYFPVVPSSPRGGKACPTPLPAATPGWESPFLHTGLRRPWPGQGTELPGGERFPHTPPGGLLVNRRHVVHGPPRRGTRRRPRLPAGPTARGEKRPPAEGKPRPGPGPVPPPAGGNGRRAPRREAGGGR